MAGDGTLLSTLVARVRRKVNDESSRRFTEAVVLDAMGDARRHVALVFSPIVQAGLFEKELVETSIAANAASCNLPTDFLGVKGLKLVNNPIATGGAGDDCVECDPMPRHLIERARNRLPVSVAGSKPVYWIRRHADPAAQLLFVLPKAGSIRYFTLLYGHTYADLPAVAGGDKIDVPRDFDELIVLYASIVLTENDRKIAGPLQQEYATLESTRMSVLQGSQDQVGTEQVSSEWHDEFNEGLI